MGAPTIEIWLPAQETEAKAALPALGKGRLVISQIELDALAKNLGDFVTSFQDHLPSALPSKSGYAIDSIEINLGVNATGGIAVIGKLEAGAEAGIKVVIKRLP